MSGEHKQYLKTLLDDGRYGIIGAVQPGAKFPARFQLKAIAEEYKGYTNTFINFITRTGIENDTNKGMINAKIPTDDAYEILSAIENATNGMEKLVWDFSDNYWQGKQRSKEAAVLVKIVVGVNKDGLIYLSLLDARNDGRAKIPFYFGHNPTQRAPFITSLETNKFEMSLRAAKGWVEMIRGALPTELNRVIAAALQGVSDKGPDAVSGASVSAGTDVDFDDSLPF